MWKWTNPNDIKVIILDLDSLEHDYLTFPYEKYIQNVQLYYVKHNNSLESIHDGVMYYFDISSLIQQILIKSACDSTSVISISNRSSFLKEMMQNHIGTILTDDLKKDFLKYTPDFTTITIEKLPLILKNESIGYGAEVYATYGESRSKMSLLKCEYELSLTSGIRKKGNIYFGGRYYAEGHQYIFNDPLSYTVINFKNQYSRSVDLFFDSAIRFIRNFGEVDIITYIPLKPSDLESGRFNRFEELKLDKCAEMNLSLQEILICKKNFSQKGNDLFMRKEAVKGAFALKKGISLKGKNIVVIDDVYSSGSTINEAIKTLYENEAKSVSVIILAINQLTESYLKYKHLRCSVCGSKMALKLNSKTNKLFFGCTNYKAHESINSTMDIEEGMSRLKDMNKLIISDIVDLEDEY